LNEFPEILQHPLPHHILTNHKHKPLALVGVIADGYSETDW